MPSANTIKLRRSLWGHCMREAEKRLGVKDKHAIRQEGQRLYEGILSDIKEFSHDSPRPLEGLDGCAAKLVESEAEIAGAQLVGFSETKEMARADAALRYPGLKLP